MDSSNKVIMYVGDVTSQLQVQAQIFDSNAKLIKHGNFTLLHPGTYYASLGNFKDLEEFISVLSHADKIVYVPENVWSDTKDNFSFMKHWTEYYLCYFSSRKEVAWDNSDITHSMLNLVDNRASPNKQLWIAGCSISNGNGVTKETRYGQLIADRLSLPVSFLTAQGSSVAWATDQILRSDIRSDDIVVWGITGFNRYPYFINDKVEHITTQYYAKHPEFNSVISIDALSSDNTTYQAVISIHQVINFCKKNKIRLYLAGMIVPPECAPYLKDLPNYIQFAGWPGVKANDRYLDVGTDNLHPGPLTHQWYADTLIEKIKND